MKILGLFRRTPPSPVERRVEIIARDPLRLSIEEFRADPTLVAPAAKALRDPIVRQMLDTLWFSHLGRLDISRAESEEMRLAFADRAAGFTMALNALEELGKPLPENRSPTPTYAAENAYTQ